MRVSADLRLFAFYSVFLVLKAAQAQTWTQTGAPSNAWAAIACSADGSNLVAAAGGQVLNGQIYTSTNSGANWNLTAAPMLRWTSVAGSADGRKLIAAAYDRGIYTSTDAGTSWISNNVNFPFGLWLGVSSSADGSQLFAVRYANDLVYHSTNSGAVWLTTTSHLADVVSVATSADGVIVVGSDNNGHVATSTTSGAIWSTNTSIGGNVSWVNASAGAQVLTAVAINRGVFSSTNKGSTWTSNSLPTSVIWRAATSSADGTKLTAVGYYPGSLIYSSLDSGASWISNNAPSLAWQAVASSSDGNAVFAASTNGGIWVRRASAAPLLNIANSTNGLVISWLIPSSNFVLQQSADPAFPSWTDVTNAPALELPSLQNRVTAPFSTDSAFYRLKLE